MATAINGGESLSTTAAALGVSYKAAQEAAKKLEIRVNRNTARPVYGDEMRAAALARCRQGQETAGAIARSLGVSDTWVLGLAKAAGVAMPRAARLSQAVADIVARYENGESGAQIAESLGVTDVAVLKRLHQQGVALREPGTAARRWSLRHDAFADVTDTQAAYWAGFLGSSNLTGHGCPAW